MAQTIEPPPTVISDWGWAWAAWIYRLYSYVILGGRTNEVTTYTDATIALGSSAEVVMCDTSSNAIAVTLPTGNQGHTIRIVNAGTAGNNVTVSPYTGNNLLGGTASFLLADADSLLITYDETLGWY